MGKIMGSLESLCDQEWDRPLQQRALGNSVAVGRKPTGGVGRGFS